MAKAQTLKVRLDVDTSRLIAVMEALRDGLTDIAADLEALGDSFGALATSLSELEEDNDGRPDSAHR